MKTQASLTQIEHFESQKQGINNFGFRGPNIKFFKLKINFFITDKKLFQKNNNFIYFMI